MPVIAFCIYNYASCITSNDWVIARASNLVVSIDIYISHSRSKIGHYAIILMCAYVVNGIDAGSINGVELNWNTK